MDSRFSRVWWRDFRCGPNARADDEAPTPAGLDLVEQARKFAIRGIRQP